MPLSTADDNLREVIRICQSMIDMANLGDAQRKDIGCGVVYGALRDDAYKIRKLAHKELSRHRDGRTTDS